MTATSPVSPAASAPGPLESTAAAPRPGVARTIATRTLWLGLAVVVLLGVMLLSIAVGTRPIAVSVVIDALTAFDGSTEHLIVTELRLPRTLLGFGCGAALGLAGAIMQALTRNPLADPGILGVNAGAAFAVVTAIFFFGFTSLTSYVWFAFTGALVTTVGVYALGSVGRSGATPVRLALSGVAIAAVLGGMTQAMTLIDIQAFDHFRHWTVGALAGRGMDTVAQVAPFLTAGVLLALGMGRLLNAVAMGDDLAKSLGASVVRARITGVVAITLLCGAATAATGPIGFLGLTVPHMARAVTGPDHRWVLPYALVLSPILLLSADILGRVVARPGELQVGLVTAFVGAPVFIALVRRKRLAKL